MGRKRRERARASERTGREEAGCRSFEMHPFGECQLGEGSLSRDLNADSVIVN